MRLQKQINEDQVMNGLSQEQILNTICDNEKPKPKKKWTVGAIINTTLFYLLVAILLVIVVFLCIGYRPAIVLTGSMRPEIQPGDVTVYRDVEASSLKVGDVIMFRGIDAGSNNTTIDNVTHRIIELHLDDAVPYVITHGDANSEGSNEKVTVSQIQGRVEFVIPWIGIPLNFIRNNLMIFLFGAISIILISYIISLMRKKNDDEKNQTAI